jgi:DNA-binding IclR family transcriptional regulator
VSEATSADRVFQILEMFERERRPLSLKDLSDYCQIPTSTCHSLVQILLRRGYLYQTGTRKELYPTRRLQNVGTTISAHDPILQRLTSAMEKLRQLTQETVILGRRQRDQVVYLEVLDGPQTIRYSANAGDLKPLHSSSIGKTLLSVLSPQELHSWTAGRTLESVTGATITTYARLIEALEEGRRAGYFTTRGENVADVTAAAVPLQVNGETFGLAVAGPSHRMEAHFDTVVEHLKSVRSELIDDGLVSS